MHTLYKSFAASPRYAVAAVYGPRRSPTLSGGQDLFSISPFASDDDATRNRSRRRRDGGLLIILCDGVLSDRPRARVVTPGFLRQFERMVPSLPFRLRLRRLFMVIVDKVDSG